MPRASKKQQRLKGDGFWDTLTSWGRTLRDYPKLITEGPVSNPAGSISSPGLPDKSILKDIADNSYKGTSDEMKDIPGYTLKLKTPTLVIYQKDGDNVMVIGVRGTADFRDFRAWFSTAFNVIPDSQRFKEDVAEVAKFQQEYPVSTYTYYATGHSLGGTLIDELIKKGMVKEARTYNPAIETDDIPNVALSQKNHRIYADGDPLYLLQGRYDNPTEVRKSYKYYPSSVMDFVPGYDKYKQHILANPVFVGGKTKGKKVVMEPKDYYAEHRNISSLLDTTGKALQKEAEDQRKEATQMAKKLGHANPFYHLQGAGIMANSQFYRTDPKRLGRGTIVSREPREDDGPAGERVAVHADGTIREDCSPERLNLMKNAIRRANDFALRSVGWARDTMTASQINRFTQLFKNTLGVNNMMREVLNDNDADIRTLAQTPPDDREAVINRMAGPICRSLLFLINNAHQGQDPNNTFQQLSGRGFFDDIKEGFKKGVESRIGKIPEPAVLTPEQQADARRRQHIQDVDKQRAKMVASKKQVAIDDLMGYAQHPNALKAIYAREGTDNAKDYLARIVEKATKTAEKFYPY